MVAGETGSPGGLLPVESMVLVWMRPFVICVIDMRLMSCVEILLHAMLATASAHLYRRHSSAACAKNDNQRSICKSSKVAR